MSLLTKIKENDYVLIKGYNSYEKIVDISTIDDKFYLLADDEKMVKSIFPQLNIIPIVERKIINNMYGKEKFIYKNIIVHDIDKYKIFIDLWKIYYESSTSKVKLILISNTPNVIETPFKFTEKNTFIVPTSTKTVKLEYYNKDLFHRNHEDIMNKFFEIISTKWKRERRNEGKWLILLPNKKECNRLHYKLKKNIKTDILMINEETENRYIKKINDSNSEKIIITCIKNLNIKGVNRVFDSLLKTSCNENNIKLRYNNVEHITKDEADQRLNYLNSDLPLHCFRMCKYDFYQRLYLFKVPNVIKLDHMYYYLLIKKYFPDYLKNMPTLMVKDKYYNKTLFNLHLLDKGDRISKAGDFILSFDEEDFYSSLFIWKWKEKSLPIFPGIVYISIIKNYSYNFGSYGKDGDSKLQYLMEICYNYFKEFKTLETEKTILKDYCNIVEINTQYFKELLENIRSFIINLEGDVKLGLYTIQNVIKEGNTIMREIFYDKVLEIITEDHKKIHYTDEENNIYVIDEKFVNKYFTYPENLICVENFKKDGKFVIKNFIPL